MITLTLTDKEASLLIEEVDGLIRTDTKIGDTPDPELVSISNKLNIEIFKTPIP
jgi:hypothetical protein